MGYWENWKKMNRSVWFIIFSFVEIWFNFITKWSKKNKETLLMMIMHVMNLLCGLFGWFLNFQNVKFFDGNGIAIHFNVRLNKVVFLISKFIFISERECEFLGWKSWAKRRKFKVQIKSNFFKSFLFICFYISFKCVKLEQGRRPMIKLRRPNHGYPINDPINDAKTTLAFFISKYWNLFWFLFLKKISIELKLDFNVTR